MALSFPIKYADEVLDYAIDWTAKLAGDTIISATATATTGGLTVDREDHSDTMQTFWLSGGTPGTGMLLCEVITSGGRTLAQPIPIPIG